MKIGTFNIHDYIGKLHENVDEKNLTLNEEDSAGKLSDTEGIIIPEDNRKAYDWLKKEYQKGKTEVKVEMSSHEFKPGYNLDTNQKSVKDFKPGMYGNVKTFDSENSKREKAVPFPETKFPGGEAKAETKTEAKGAESMKPKVGEKKQGSSVKVDAKVKDTEKAGQKPTQKYTLPNQKNKVETKK